MGDLPLTGSPLNPIRAPLLFLFLQDRNSLPTCTYRRRFAQLNLIWSIPTKGRSSQIRRQMEKKRSKCQVFLFDGGVWPLWPAPVTVHFFFIFICKRLKEDLRFTRSLLNHPHYQSGPELQKARIEVTSATCPMGGKKRKSFSSNGNFKLYYYYQSSTLCALFFFVPVFLLFFTY